MDEDDNETYTDEELATPEPASAAAEEPEKSVEPEPKPKPKFELPEVDAMGSATGAAAPEEEKFTPWEPPPVDPNAPEKFTPYEASAEDKEETFRPYVEPEGILATAGREFAHGVPGAVAGAAVGGYAGGVGGTLIGGPVGTAVGTIGGGLIGGFGGGWAGTAAKDVALGVIGHDDAAQREANRLENPWAHAIGSGLSMATAGTLGLAKGAVSTAGRLFGGGVGGAVETGSQVYEGHGLKEAIPPIVASTAAGAAFAKPYGYGQAAHEAGVRLGERIRPPKPVIAGEPPGPAPPAPPPPDQGTLPGVGGGERQLEMPLEPKPKLDTGYEQGALDLKPPSPATPPSTVDANGQLGFVITDPHPKPNPAGVDGAGSAKEAAPPPRGEPDPYPHSSVRRGIIADSAGVKSDNGINVMQPGQLDPTIYHGLKRGEPDRPQQMASAEPRAPRAPEEPPPAPRGPMGDQLERDFPTVPEGTPTAPLEAPKRTTGTQGVTEPVLPEGHTRFYQGERQPNRQFTTDRAVAEQHGPVRYVDVAQDSARQWFRPGRMGGTEFLTENPNFRNRSRPLDEVMTEPIERGRPPQQQGQQLPPSSPRPAVTPPNSSASRQAPPAPAPRSGPRPSTPDIDAAVTRAIAPKPPEAPAAKGGPSGVGRQKQVGETVMLAMVQPDGTTASTQFPMKVVKFNREGTLASVEAANGERYTVRKPDLDRAMFPHEVSKPAVPAAKPAATAPVQSRQAILKTAKGERTVRVSNEPPKKGKDGREYQKVSFKGKDYFVPAEQLTMKASPKPQRIVNPEADTRARQLARQGPEVPSPEPTAAMNPASRETMAIAKAVEATGTPEAKNFANAMRTAAHRNMVQPDSIAFYKQKLADFEARSGAKAAGTKPKETYSVRNMLEPRQLRELDAHIKDRSTPVKAEISATLQRTIAKSEALVRQINEAGWKVADVHGTQVSIPAEVRAAKTKLSELGGTLAATLNGLKPRLVKGKPRDTEAITKKNVAALNETMGAPTKPAPVKAPPVEKPVKAAIPGTPKDTIAPLAPKGTPTPDSFWSYRPEARPTKFELLPKGVFEGTKAEWEAFSPGMRREIVRDATNNAAPAAPKKTISLAPRAEPPPPKGDPAHLSALEVRASHERDRLARAKTPKEKEQRKVWVDQAEKEAARERALIAGETPAKTPKETIAERKAGETVGDALKKPAKEPAKKLTAADREADELGIPAFLRRNVKKLASDEKGGGRLPGLRSTGKLPIRRKVLERERAGGTAAYHGTTSPIDRFRGLGEPRDQHMPDRMLGYHFAKDPAVSNSFIMERVNDGEHGAKLGGRMMPVRLPHESKFLDLDQPHYDHAKGKPRGAGTVETDQLAVAKAIAAEAYPKRPDILAKFLETARNVPKADAEVMARDLVAGKTVDLPHDGPHDLKRLISNFTGAMPYEAGLKRELVRAARESWQEQGYKGIKYTNTSPMETMKSAGVKDPTSYLVFDPQDVKGRFTDQRPTKTERIPISETRQQAVLEEGARRAENPQPTGEPPQRVAQAASRKTVKPSERPQVKTHDGTVFTGDTEHAAAVFARGAGYKPHQIFQKNGQPYKPPAAPAAPATASTAPQTAAPSSGGRGTQPPSRPPTGGQPPAAPPPQGPGGPVAAARARIQAQVAPRSSWISKVPTSLADAKKMWRAAYTAIKNDLDPIEQVKKAFEKSTKTKLSAENDFYMLARLTRGLGGRFNQIIKNGTYDISTGKVNGKGLDEVVKPIQDHPEEFTTYALAKRAIELNGRGIETGGITMPDAHAVVAADAARFEPVFRDLHAFQDRVLQNLVHSGILSDAQATKMRQLNKEYVPFYRMLDPKSDLGIQLGAGLQTRSPIHEIKGSKQGDIIDPMDSIVKNTYLFTDLAERNRALIEMKRANDLLPPDEQFMTRDRNTRPIEVQPGEIQRFMDQHGIKGVADDSMTIFRPDAFRPDKETIRLFNNGKAEIYKVPENLGNAVNNMDRASLNLLVKVFATPAKMLRAGAVLAPEFILRNPLRDIVAAFVQSKNGSIPIVTFLDGLKHVFKQSDVFQDWQINGGANANLVSMDRSVIHLEPKTLTGKVANVITKPYQMLQMLSELSENASRVGMHARGLKRGIHPLESAFNAREGTLDFARMGASTTYRALNALIPFFNAQIEGVDQAVRSFRDRPIEASLKAGASITMPSVLLWFNNKDDERVQQLPSWQKDLFWIVPTDDWKPITGEGRAKMLDKLASQVANLDKSKLTHTFRQAADGSWEYNDGNIYRIPKPFELGVLFGSVPERILDAYYKDNPNAFKDLGKTLERALTPSFTPQSLLPGLEQFANQSMFLERPLLTDKQKKLPPAQQYGPHTSETAKTVAAAIRTVAGDKTSFGSPIIVDNYIRQWTGGLGKHVTDMIDMGLKAGKDLPVTPTRTMSDIPGLKAFAVRFPGSGSQAVQDFYDTHNERKLEQAGIKDQFDKDPMDAKERLKKSSPSVGDDFAKLLAADRKAVERITNDRKMSADDKRAAIDLTYLIMIEHAKKGNALFEKTKRK